VPRRVQAEGEPPGAPGRLLRPGAPALPHPPPPRALHAREHPGHDGPSVISHQTTTSVVYIRRARTYLKQTASSAFTGGGGGSSGCGGGESYVGAGHLRKRSHNLHGHRSLVLLFASTGTGTDRGSGARGWVWLYLQGSSAQLMQSALASVAAISLVRAHHSPHKTYMMVVVAMG
jgi:hypothetical protein